MKKGLGRPGQWRQRSSIKRKGVVTEARGNTTESERPEREDKEESKKRGHNWEKNTTIKEKLWGGPGLLPRGGVGKRRKRSRRKAHSCMKKGIKRSS